jgi:hypothetical protein
LQAEESGPLGPVVDVIRRLGTQVVRHAGGHGRWVVGGGGGPGGGGGVRDGSAPVDVVAGYAAAAIAGAAPGEVGVAAGVLPYAVAGVTARIDRGRIVRGSDVVFESERVRPAREVAGVVFGAYRQVISRLGRHGRRVVSGRGGPGRRGSALGRGPPVDVIPGHAAAAVARPAPGEIRVADVFLPGVIQDAVHFGDARRVGRRGGVVPEGEGRRRRPAQPVAGVVFGVHPQVMWHTRSHGELSQRRRQAGPGNSAYQQFKKRRICVQPYPHTELYQSPKPCNNKGYSNSRSIACASSK